MGPKITIAVIVCVTSALACGDMLQPWTIAETSLFSTTDSPPANGGSGWFGNTLVLNYGGGDGSVSQRDGSSETGTVLNFIPSNAIGFSFGVSATTQSGRIQVWAQKWSVADEFIFQQDVYNRQFDMDFSGNVNSLFSSGPDAVSPIDYSYDIPESTLNGITTVEFIFIQDLVGAPVSKFRFVADSRDPFSPTNNILLAGATTFSDVSWIISDGGSSPLPSPFGPNPNVVPLPGSVLLVVFAVGYSGVRLKRMRTR